jgi:hypothetical protein
MPQITAADHMPTCEDQLLDWIREVIAEVTLCNQSEVAEWQESDLLNCLSDEETDQWLALPESVRLPLLMQARDMLFEQLGEEAYEAYYYG